LSTLAPVEERGLGAFALQHTDRARVFRRAKRHSRLVRFLRRALPGGILVAALLVLLASWLDPLRMLTKLPLDVSGVVISGTKITMQQPRIAGFTRDGRAYELTAHAAAQEITKPDTIELQGVSGNTETSDRAMLTLTADNGVYDNKSNILTLRNNVVFKSSAGLAVNLSEAAVDVHSGGIVSEKPVEVKFAQGTINAARLEVVDSGDVIRFEGDVNMVLKGSGQLLPVGDSLRVP
jgi:lipopolysaccharide export system protein LptC